MFAISFSVYITPLGFGLLGNPIYYTRHPLCTFPAVQWIQRKYGSTVAHHAKVLASSSDEVGDDLRDLAPASHLENLCQARAGTEVVDLEVTTGNKRQEKNTVVCRLGRPSESSLICSTDRM